jgi:hypothetical protein
MKVGDLITKKANSRLYNEVTPPLRTVVRVIRSQEPRLHGRSPFYITLDDDPSKWEDPTGYFIVSAA